MSDSNEAIGRGAERDGDHVETVIEKLVTGGAGLGRTADGQALFVPSTIPGERVRVRVIRRRKGYGQAELVGVLEASPDRIEPPLGEIGALSGCDLQHMSIEAQRRAKTEIVRDCFRRLGKIDPGDRLTAPAAAGPALGYRNKLRLWRSPIGPYGVRRKGSHDVIPVERHGLMPDLFNDVALPFLTTLPPVDEAVTRLDGRGGFLLSLFGPPGRLRALRTVLAEAPDKAAPCPGCVGILFNNRPVWGRDHLLVETAGQTFRVNAGSFFQVNHAEAEATVALAGDWLDGSGMAPDGVLADLYCGVGLFAVCLGDRFERVIGVENDARAVRDARNNLKRDRKREGEVEILSADAAAVLARWREGPWRDGDHRTEAPDWPRTTVVLDPPRTGLGDAATANLAALGPTRIIYLSCDPATLARDIATLTAGGYELVRARVIDMFPQTSHVECLAELVRAESRTKGG